MKVLLLLGLCVSVYSLPTASVEAPTADATIAVNPPSSEVVAEVPAEAAPAPVVAVMTQVKAEESSSLVTTPTTTAPSTSPPVHSSCPRGKCKRDVTKACKGREDACRNETECCEIDKCNVWQHIGRDSAALLVFYVSWCPVSRDFMLNYDLLRAQYEPYDNVLIAKIDADQNPNLVNDFGINEFPGLVFFRRDCYWSAQGCNDQMAWRLYNGTSNDYEEVDKWIQFQLSEEQNANSFRQLPEEADSVTGCHVWKTSLPPADMRPPPSERAPQMLLQTEESVLKRPSCVIDIAPVDEE